MAPDCQDRGVLKADELDEHAEVKGYNMLQTPKR